MKESDLYPPLKAFLEAQGYTVKGEIQGCDVVALREPEPPVVVELKRSLNLTVVLQATDRLSVSDTVYIGVPESLAIFKKQRKRVLRLLRMLGLGLLTIEPKKGRVAVMVDPGPYAGPRISKVRQKRLLGEFALRVGDPNRGGSDRRRGLLTAYRQRALAIAAHLRTHGDCKAADVAKAVDDEKARAVLYDDVYGWFCRVSRGVYGLTPAGAKGLVDWGMPPDHGAVEGAEGGDAEMGV